MQIQQFPDSIMLKQFINSKIIHQNHTQQQINLIQQSCQICYINYTKIKNQLFRPAHICYQCWYQHVKTNLTKISYMVGSDIISPFEMQDQIDVCIALNGLKKSHRQELQQLLYKKYTTFTKDIEKCPSETCDFVFTIEKCKWSTGINHLCPKCQTPLNISQNFTLKSVLGFVYFIFLANKCPKCQIPIQRISGCPHMTCPCGHQFCWFCLKDHAYRQNNLYTVHQPKQCASIFFSKIIILITCLLSLSCFLVGGRTLRTIMDGFFSFLGYVIHSLIIDLWLFAQFAIHNIYTNQPYRNFPFQRSSKNVKILIYFGLNVIFYTALYYLDLLQISLVIVVVQAFIAGFIASIIYGIMFSCETWFQFIT